MSYTSAVFDCFPKSFVRSTGKILWLFSVAVLISCTEIGGPHPGTPGEEEPPARPLGEIHILDIKTYDGADQVVHPDVVRVPESFSASPLFMAITPYPFGNASEENPSIYTSSDGFDWTPPASDINPLARPINGHLSDPDLVYNSTKNELWMYYRQASYSSTNDVFLIKSKDGMTWTSPQLVVQTPSHELLSPSVVKRSNNKWMMWSVNGGRAGCSGARGDVELRTSVDGETWSLPKKVNLSIDSITPWHLDVIWVESSNEYWAVYNGKTAGSCTTQSLYFATSKNGVEWKTFGLPVLSNGEVDAFQDIVYRATLDYDSKLDELTFWHSGAQYTEGRYVWKAGIQKIKRSDVLKLDRPATEVRTLSKISKRVAPPLTDDSMP